MKRKGEVGGLPDRARPLAMRGHPKEQPVLSRCKEGEACVSEEGQSFRDKEEEDFSFAERTPERDQVKSSLFKGTLFA